MTETDWHKTGTLGIVATTADELLAMAIVVVVVVVVAVDCGNCVILS